MRKILLFFFGLSIVTFSKIYSQTSCPTCSAVTSFTANLSSNPNNTYTVSSNRSGLCCQGSGSDRCVRFEVSVHPSATQIQFLVSTGNNGTWEINCAPPLYTPSSKPCLNGLTNFCITYCNPGGGSDTYTISTSTGLGTGADLNLRGGCTGSLTVRGLLESSINWTSVFPGAAGAYNSYLSCLTGCDTTNVTPAAGAPTYIDYKVCGSAVGCAATNYCDTQRVYVSPALLYTINPAAPVLCSASSGSLALTTTVTGGNPPYTYSWSPGGQTTSSIVVNTSGTYSVSVNDNTSGCGAVTQSIVVASATTPTASASPSSLVLCSGQTTSITLSSNSGTTTYSWITSQSGVTGASNGSGSLIIQTLTTTGLSSGTVIYTITPTDAGCTGNSIVVTVTVNPAPTMTATPVSQALCSGGTTSFSLTSNVAGTNYSWTATETNATGASASSGSVIAQSLTATTTSGSVVYTITPTYNSCPGVVKTVSVTVNPAPTVTATPSSQALCSGNTTSIALTGGVAGTTYSWTVTQTGISGASASSGTNISQSLSTTGTSSGTVVYTITPIANSCNGTPIVVTVSVNPVPTVTATPSSQALCSGNASSIALTSNVAGTTYSWTVTQTNITGATASTGTTIAQTLSTTTTSSGTAVYTITPSSNGCGGSTQTATVTVNPKPVMTSTNTAAICSGNSFSINLTSNVASTYTWIAANNANTSGESTTTQSSSTLSDGITNNTSNIQTVVYTVTPTSTGGSCLGTSQTVNVTVNPAPTVTATPSSQALCSGNTTSIALTGGVAGTTYSWTVTQTGVTGASASTGTNIAQTLSTTGTSLGTAVYTVTPSANGCNGTPVVVTVSVSPTPSVTATPASQTLCSGNTSGIALTSNVAGTTFSWTVTQTNVTGASASTGTNIAQTLSTTTTSSGTAVYTITPSSNGCGGTTTVVTVAVNPTPVMTSTNTGVICSAGTITIPLTSNITSNYTWIAADNANTSGESTSVQSTNTINNTITNSTTTSQIVVYTVTPTSTAGSCLGAAQTVSVTVNPTPVMTSTDAAVVCSASSFSIALTSNVASTYTWIAVNNANTTGESITTQTATTLSNVITNTTTSAQVVIYTVTPTTSAGSCAGVSQTVSVTVNPKPVMTSTNTAAICSGNSFSIALTSNVASTYTWIATNNANTSGESTTTQSSSTLSDGITNNTSNIQTVVYTVTPTSTGGSCLGTSQTVNVTVNPAPTVTATPSSQALCSGNTTSIALTGGVAGTTYSWTVTQTGVTGASASTGTNIAQTLSTTGTSIGTAVYTITPSANGCNGTPVVVTVSVSPTPSVTATPASQTLCSGNASSIALTSNVAGTTFSWTVTQTNVTGTSASTGTNIAQTLSTTTTSSGTAVYTITPSSNGCGGTTTVVTVAVNPTPVMTSTNTGVICSAGTITIPLTSNIASNYTWIAADNANTSGESTSIQSTNSINNTITNSTTSAQIVIYTVTPTSTAGSCAGAAQIVSVTVNPTPVMTSTNAAIVCSASSFSIALTSNVASTYTWIAANNANTTGESITTQTATTLSNVITNTTTSAQVVIYTVTPTTSAGSCAGVSQTISVTVNPKPVMTSTNTAAICSGNSFSITLTSNVASTYTWIAANNANTTGESTTTQSGTTLTDAITNNVTSSQIVVYTVTPTSTGGSCLGTSQTVSVTVNVVPTLTSATTATICSGGTVVLPLSSNVTSTYTWIAVDNTNTTGESLTTQSTGTINNTIISSTGNTENVLYNVTPTSTLGSCIGATNIFTVTISPTPVVTVTPTSQAICSGNTATVSLNSNVSGTTYTWTVAQTNVNGASAGTGTVIAQTLTATTAGSGFVTYTVTPTIGTCSGVSSIATITVSPIPTVSATPGSQILCSGNTTSVTLSSNVTGTTYSWTTAQTNVSGASAGTGSVIAQTLSATSSIQGSVVYTITPSNNGCLGTPVVVTVSVNPTPSLTVTPGSQALCTGAVTSLSLTSNVAGTTYSWTVSQTNASGASAGSGSVIAQTITATTTSLGTVVYTITPSASACAGAPIVATVSVAPIPAAPTATNSGPVCVNGTLNLTAGTISGATYNWTGPNSFSSSVQNPTITNIPFAGAGVYTVNVTVNGCTGPNRTTTVVVNPPPPTTLTVSSNSPLCSTKTLSLSVATVTAATYSWSGPNGFTSTLQNPTITNASTLAAGVYSITATVSGCGSSGTETLAVVVNQTPAAPVVANNGPLCVGATLNLTASGTATTYSWTGPGGFTNTNQNPSIATVSLTNAGVYSVTATSNGCTSNRGTTTVVVNAIPATPTPTTNAPVCVGQTISLSTSSVSGATYNWNGPNSYTASAQNTTVTTNASTVQAGTYSLNITVNGCSSLTGTVNVAVNTAPSTPTASASPACLGDTLFLFANSSVSSTYSWSGPNGFTSTLQNPYIANVTNLANGSYTVIANNGCTSTPGVVSITVTPKPATPIVSSNSPVCEGSNLNLSASNTGTSYNWSGPNSYTASVQNPTITNITSSGAGVYSVTAMANGCSSNTGTVSVVVNPIPAIPTVGNTSPVCTGQSFNLTVTPVLGATYAWSGPNSYTSSVQSPTLTNVTLTQAGDYSLTITVNGCSSSSAAVTSVTINATPVTPTLTNNGPLCEGATLNLTASGTETSYNWSGPSGYNDNTQNPSINNITLTQAGTYSVTATTNGCTSAIATTSVTINPIPATPTVSTNAPVCVGQTISLSTPSVSGATYSWSGPNSYTSSVQNPTVTTNASALQAGTYSLNITVNGCVSAEGTVVVGVNNAAASPTVTSNSPICAGDSLHLYASSDVGSTYSWSGPNSFTSSLQNPFIANTTTLATGLYTVVANNGCASVPGVVTVTVIAKPNTPTISSNSPLCEGGNLTLNASSTGTSYSWSGPNSYTASVQNPTITNVTIANAGVYSVTAMANGCSSNTRTVNIVINPIPATPVVGNTSPVCTGQSFNLTVTPVAGATYTWTGPNSFTSTVQSPTLTNVTSSQVGTYSLTIKVSGCLSSSPAVTTVTINNTPATPVANNNGPLCEGDNLNLTASGTETSYNWTGPNGYTDNTQNPTINNVVIAQSGTYSVTATTNGCTSGAGITTVLINAVPPTPTVSTNAPVCVGQTVTLTAETISGANYNWSGPNSYSSADQSPVLTTNASTIEAGTYSLTIEINGCASSMTTLDVAINDAAASPTVTSNSPVCSGDTLFLNAVSAGGATYTWSGPNGFTSTLQNPFIANTTTLISGSYTVIADNGCSSLPAVVTATVIQTPGAPIITSNSPVCIGNTLNLSASLVAGATYNWIGPNGFTASTRTVSIANATVTDQGTYSVTVTQNGCTSAPAVKTVSVTTPPLADAGSNQTVCANNATVVLTGTVSGGSSTGIWSSSGTGTFTPNASSLITSYIPSSADTAAGTVILTLTSTNNGGCAASTSSITVTITDSPVAFAGSGVAVCANNADINLNGVVYGGSSTGSWSTSGSGTFNPDANTLNATYVPSAADVTNGTVTFTLTTTNNGQCLAVSSQMTATITGAPTTNAGPDQITCKATPNATLSGTVVPTNSGTWTTLGSGTFNPNANSLNTTYIPSQADTAAGSVILILTSTNNGGCLAVSDTMKLSFSDIPSVTAGSNQTVCANNALVTLNGLITGGGSAGIWTSSGTGTFTPSATALNASYTPSVADTTAGAVTLTLTSTSGCVVVSDQISITINPAPFVNAGANISVCANNAIANYNGSISGVTTTGIWSTTGSGTFNPDNTTLSGSYTPSAGDISAGSVYLILTSTNNGDCAATVDSLKLTITPPPAAFAGNDTTICANNNLVLNGIITGGVGTGSWSTSGTGSFTPNGNSLTASYVPSAADTTAHQVVLTLTSTNNGGCIAAVDDFTVTITPGPTVDAGLDQTVCSNTGTIALTGLVTVATGVQWTTLGNGSFSSVNSTSTTYSLGTTDITNGQVKIVVNSTGNGDCVAASDTVVITIQSAPVVNAGTNKFVCQGIMSVNINGSISGSTTTGVWSTLGSGTFASTTNLNTTYSLSTADTTAGSVQLVLTSTNSGVCNQVTDTVLITITPAGFATVGNDTTVCASDSIINLAGVIMGGTGAGQWSSSGTGVFSSNTTLNTTYTISAADMLAGNVTIKLSPINSCLPTADSLVITINPKPIVNAGTDITVCSSVHSAVLSSTVSGGSSTATWSTLGTGTFSPDANSLNATYNISSADSTAGSVQLVLTSTNNGVCSAVTDTVKIIISNSTFAFVGNDTTICSNDSLMLAGNIMGGSAGQWSSNGSGVFNPNNTTLNATFVPSANDITNGNVIIKLTPVGGCQPTADSLTLSFNIAPVVDAGTNITVCSSVHSVTLNGTVSGGSTSGTWTTLGTGSFSPDANTLNAIYNISSADSTAGSVQLVLTSTNNGVCSATTDTLKIVMSNATFALAGNDTTICSNDSLALAGNIIGGSAGQWSSNGSGVFNPSNTSLNATYVPSANDITNGSVVIKLIPTGGCQPLADSLTLTFNLTPVVIAGTNTVVCASTNTLALNGNVSGGSTTGIWTTSGSGLFLPNDSTLNATYQISSADSLAGEVTLYLTSTHNGICGSAVDSMKVLISTPAIATVGNDMTVCANNASAILSATVTGGTGQGQWSSSGSGIFIPDNTSLNTSYIPGASDVTSGAVSIKFTPINGCSNQADSLVLTITPSPTVSAGTDQVLCGGISTVSLAGTINTVPTGAIWTTNGLGTFTPNDSTLNGSYIPNVADNDTLMFVLTTSGNGLCNAVTDTMYVFQNSSISADYSVTPACASQAVTFTDASSVGTSSVTTWNWNFGNGDLSSQQNPSYTYSLTGTYTVSLKIVTTEGCSDSIAKTITVNPTPVANYTYAATCSNDSVKFTDASSISGGVINTWNWNFGDGNTSTTQNPNHLFDSVKVCNVSVTATSDLGCSATSSQTISVSPSPVAGFSLQANCGALAVNFTDTSKVASGTITSWNWNFGDSQTSTSQNPTNTYANVGTYTIMLQIQTDKGCRDSITSTVDLTQALVAEYTPHGGSYNINEEVSFTNQSIGATNYTWNFGDGTSATNSVDPTHAFSSSGSYPVTLIATNNTGCADTVVYVFDIKTSGYDVPSGFTPNADGTNDLFYVIGGPFSNYELRVFNEWGNQIFMSSSQTEKWDGTYKGVAQPAGTYIYIFNGKVVNGDEVKLKGEVNIIR